MNYTTPVSSAFLRAITKTVSPDGSPNPPHSLPIAPAIVALYDGTADLYEYTNNSAAFTARTSVAVCDLLSRQAA